MCAEFFKVYHVFRRYASVTREEFNSYHYTLLLRGDVGSIKKKFFFTVLAVKYDAI